MHSTTSIAFCLSKEGKKPAQIQQEMDCTSWQKRRTNRKTIGIVRGSSLKTNNCSSASGPNNAYPLNMQNILSSAQDPKSHSITVFVQSPDFIVQLVPDVDKAPQVQLLRCSCLDKVLLDLWAKMTSYLTSPPQPHTCIQNAILTKG